VYMIKYYVTGLGLLSTIALCAAENSLQRINTIPACHSTNNLSAVGNCYRWLEDSKRVSTQKKGGRAVVWNINALYAPVGITRESATLEETFETLLEPLIRKTVDNRELVHKISSEKSRRIDEQTYNRLRNLPIDQVNATLEDGWEEHFNQPNKARLYLRPDGSQYVLTELEEDPTDPTQYHIETVYVNDAETETPIKTFKSRALDGWDFPTVQNLQFDWSPDSQKFAIVDTYHEWNPRIGREIITPETVEIYETDDFSVRQSFTIDGAIKELSFSPNSRWLAAYSHNTHDKTERICIWNIVRGYLAATLANEHNGRRSALSTYQLTPLSNIWSPDGTKIATYNADGNVNVYRLPQN
jgi:hypothetical protein